MDDDFYDASLRDGGGVVRPRVTGCASLTSQARRGYAWLVSEQQRGAPAGFLLMYAAESSASRSHRSCPVSVCACVHACVCVCCPG